jgi:hypothetical protein
LIKARDYNNLIYAIPRYRYKIASEEGNKTDSVLEKLTGSDWVLASGGKRIGSGRTYLEITALGSDDPCFVLLLLMRFIGGDGKTHRTHY